MVLGSVVAGGSHSKPNVEADIGQKVEPNGEVEVKPEGAPEVAPEPPSLSFDQEFLQLQVAMNRVHDVLYAESPRVDHMKKAVTHAIKCVLVLYQAHQEEVSYVPDAPVVEPGADTATLLREALHDKQVLVRVMNSQERRKKALEDKLNELTSTMAELKTKYVYAKADAKKNILMTQQLKGVNLCPYDMSQLVDVFEQQMDGIRRVKYMMMRRKAEQLVAESVDGVLCPIGRMLMRDPVLAPDGHTYERVEIEKWLKESDRSPKTLEPLALKTLVSNHSMKSLILELVDQHLQQLMKNLDSEVAAACVTVHEKRAAEQRPSASSQAKRRRGADGGVA